MKKQEIDDVFDEHKEIYLFFRRPPSEFNYMIQRALEAIEKQEIDTGFDETKVNYLFSELLAHTKYKY